MNDHGVLILAIGFAALAALAGVWLVLQLLYTRVMLKNEQSRSQLLFLHLGETQAALQTALGGGWQLADPNKDVFLLPEAAILDFSDTLTGGRREHYRRSSTVRVFTDHDLYQRVINADRLGIPISFRGLEWRLTQLGQVGHTGFNSEFSHIGGPQSECILELATYAARKG